MGDVRAADTEQRIGEGLRLLEAAKAEEADFYARYSKAQIFESDRAPNPTHRHRFNLWLQKNGEWLLVERARHREALVEQVAEALYERAMSERRTFSRHPEQFQRSWRDEPYVPLLQDGKSRPKNWRDGWRHEARAVLRGKNPLEENLT